MVSLGYIGELSDDELLRIAAESYATSSVRNAISYRLERSEAALAIVESERVFSHQGSHACNANAGDEG